MPGWHWRLLLFTIAVALSVHERSFAQWTPIEGAPETNVPVAVTEFPVGTGNGVTVFVTSTVGNVYYNTFNILNKIPVALGNWNLATFSGVVPRDWFDSPVAVTMRNGELFVFGRIKKFGNPTFNNDLPVNSIRWAHTTDNREHWTDWLPLPGGGTTREVMAAVSWKDAIYLFRTGEDGKVSMNMLLNNVWSGWSPVPGSPVLTKGLTATVTNGQLFLLGIASSNNMPTKISASIKSTHSLSWSIWEPIAGSEKSYAGLSVNNNADTELQLFGIKYNNVLHGVGYIQNHFSLPISGRAAGKFHNWDGWKLLENGDDNFYYQPLSIPSNYPSAADHIIFSIAKRKLYYRFL